MSPGCGDRTAILFPVVFPRVAGFSNETLVLTMLVLFERE